MFNNLPQGVPPDKKLELLRPAFMMLADLMATSPGRDAWTSGCD